MRGYSNVADIRDHNSLACIISEQPRAMRTYLGGAISPRCDNNQPSGPDSSSSSHQGLFEKLATETIVEIFTYVCPVVELPARISLHGPSHFNSNPAVMSMVCKRWHAITMLNHSIWATMTFTTTQVSLKEWIKWGFLQVGRCIKRTGSYPLDIRVDGDDSITDDIVIMAILNILLPHSERWRRIAFAFSLRPKFIKKFDTLEGRLPLLEHLEIHLSLSRSFQDLPTCTAFLSAPALNSVCVNPSFGITVLQQIGMPRTQISAVSFGSLLSLWSRKDFYEMLGLLSVSLNSLTFCEGFKIQLRFGQDAREIKLPRLRHLRFRNHCDTALDILICPLLEELEVYRGNEGTITRFLDRSSCALTHIKLYNLTNHEDLPEYQTVLQNPSLSTLKYISLSKITHPILDLLNFDSEQLFPLLETLQMDLQFERRGGERQRLLSYLKGIQMVVGSRTRIAALNEPESVVHGPQQDDRLSLKACFFNFDLVRNGPDLDDYWDEDMMQSLQPFCISRNILITLNISYSWDVVELYLEKNRRQEGETDEVVS